MTICTPRLKITEFSKDMAHAVHLNSLDEDNRRFVPDEVFETPQEAAETIEYLMSVYNRKDAPQVYPVLLRDGTPIGHVQAVPMEDGMWEIGFHIAKAFAHKGYATEAMSAFLPIIMEKLDICVIYGVCIAENLASKKVMQRCGFTLEYEGPGTYQDQSCQISRFRFEA